jgi:hypothetical protein
MDDKDIKRIEEETTGLVFEVGDIISKLKAKMDSLEQADIELYKAVDELDAELGFWDTIPKKKIDKSSYIKSKPDTKES